jgi:small subunit ribosomal protein S6
MAKANLEAEAEKNLLAMLKDTLTKNGADISNFQEWGKKRLTYRIKKQDEANYYLANFSLPPQNLVSIEKAYRLNENILRFMFTKKQ